MTRRRGFTLLEVVVALAITATSLAVLQRATADALRARARVETDVQRRGAIRATLAHLLQELARAVPGTLHIARPAATRDPLLEFALDEPAPELVRYRLVEHRLERTTSPRFGLGEASARPLPLLAGVQRLTVRGRDADGWHEAWDDRRVPVAIAFDLTLDSGESFATSVPLLAGGTP